MNPGELLTAALRHASAALLVCCLAGCPSKEPATVLVAPATDLISSDGKLRESIGIETLGGVFTPILSAGCALPCSEANTFSTAEDGQSEILLHLYRGTGQLTSAGHSLGTFKVFGIPPLPRGQPGAVVTFVADKDGIRLLVVDRDGKAEFKVARVGP